MNDLIDGVLLTERLESGNAESHPVEIRIGHRSAVRRSLRRVAQLPPGHRSASDSGAQRPSDCTREGGAPSAPLAEGPARVRQIR